MECSGSKEPLNTFCVSSSSLSCHVTSSLHVANESDSTTVSSHNFEDCAEAPQSRHRKKRRPFSPEPIGNTHKISGKPKIKRRNQSQDNRKSISDSSHAKSFSCDQCGSLYIVDPSRCRLPTSQLKKIPTKRHKIDPETRRVLNLCNACGLASTRAPKKERVSKQQATFSIEQRDKYLEEAALFAKSVAERVAKPAAERLYCPSFKNRPCGCIQTYLSHQGDSDGGTLETRVESLLQLLNTACDLGRRKNLLPELKLLDKKKDENSTSPVERKQRQREFEQFILETRQLLRDKLRLCERACQRILLYSNNFLHKKLKSTPNQSSRLSRRLGRNSMGQLKSIDELGSVPCCSDSCSRLALTHSALLEEWRRQAAQGQRQARRVLAEMLTPSGGTKANCYKFISMVTGCGASTISSVSHQMRKTKGNREPPEHGLKKWFREHPRKKTGLSSSSQFDQVSVESSVSSSASLNIGTKETYSTTVGQELDTKLQLEQQQQELEEARRQLQLKQQELDRCQQLINLHFSQSSLEVDSNSWELNTSKSPSKEAEGCTHLINLPIDSGITMLPTGQSVQLMDLVPGTYIAVPSSFNASTILTLASDGKQTQAISDESVVSENIQFQPQIVYSDSLQIPSTSCKSNNVLINPESCVSTIFNISTASGEVNNVFTDVEGQDPQIENNTQEVFVSAASECAGLGLKCSEVNRLHNIPVNNNAPQSIHGASGASADDLPQVPSLNSHLQFPTSLPTPVIRPCCGLDSSKPINESQMSSVIVSDEYTHPFKSVKDDESIGGFDLPTSLSSVILLSSTQESSHESPSLNTLETLFQ